ncbi:MAG TPA: FCD domain-containing protein [Baekduia sp.]|nr:FCD domain-containing protein [Baekduia sp.]
MTLELGVAAIAAKRAPHDEADALHALLDAAGEAAPSDYRRIDRQLHVMLATLTRNPQMIVSTLRNQNAIADIVAAVNRVDEVGHAPGAGHRQLVDAICAGEVERSVQLMCDHVTATTDAIAAHLARNAPQGA